MGTEENASSLANDEREDLETMSNEETRSQCKGTTKAGKQCKNTASSGSEYCYVHQRMAERPAQPGNPGNPGHAPSPEKAETDKSHQTSSERKMKDLAAFSVFFGYEVNKEGEQVWKVRVSNDASSDKKPAADTVAWVNWILERANLPVEMEPIVTKSEATAQSASAAPDKTQVEIFDADVNESPDAPGKKLVAEARCRVSSPKVETLMKKEIPFQVLFLTTNCENGQVNLVATDQGQLDPETHEYASKRAFPIPNLGIYTLETIILLLPSGNALTYRHTGPRFSVVTRQQY